MKSFFGQTLQLGNCPSKADDETEILRRVMVSTGYARGALLIRDATGGFVTAASLGVSLKPVALSDLVSEAAIPSRACLEQRVVSFGRDQHTKPLKALVDSLGGEFIAVPLVPRDVAVGLMILGDRGQRACRGRREEERLLSVAGIAGMAWEQLQAGRQLRARDLGRQILLTAASKPCAGLEALFEQILLETVHLLGVDAAAVLLLEPVTGSFVMRAQVGLNPNSVGRLRIPAVPEPLNGDGEKNGEEPFTALEPAALAASTDGTAPFLFEDIKLNKRTLGLVALYKKTCSSEHCSEIRQLLAGLASELAPVVAAASTLQTDRDLEERLQQLVRHDANFTKLLSHQLRTPLTSIRGFAQLILRQPSWDPELLRKYVDIICDKSGHLIDTIEEVRGLAAVTSDLLALKMEPVFILPLVQRVLASVAPFSRHRFELSLPVEATQVRADQERISQVINTLLFNAMRRSPSDLPILVGVESGAASVVVWVADRGVSLSRQEMDSAFEWGQPADDSIDDNGVRANSLALYACKRLVQAHGGRVWVDGEAGETRFCFELFS